jgi:polyphenol oxidase
VLRRRQEKDVREEVLVIEGIETDGTDMVKFDVYVNAMEHEKVEPGGREMAESFVCSSHPSMDGREGDPDQDEYEGGLERTLGRPGCRWRRSVA